MAVLLAAVLLPGALPMAALAEEPPASEEDGALPGPQTEEDEPLPQDQAEGDGGDEAAPPPPADEGEPDDPTAVTVSTSDGFREALRDDEVETIFFQGGLVVEYEEDGENDLEAGRKDICPYEGDRDHNRPLFAEGVTMTHISSHYGNHQSVESQSVEQIHSSDWDRIAAAEGLAG